MVIGEFIEECYAENSKQLKSKENNSCCAAQESEGKAHKEFKRNTSEPEDTRSRSSSQSSLPQLVELNTHEGNSAKLSRRKEKEQLEKQKLKLHSSPTLLLNSLDSATPHIKRHKTRSLSSASSLCSSEESSSSSSFSSESSSMWSEADGEQLKRKTNKRRNKDEEEASGVYSPPIAPIIELQKFNVQKSSSLREKSSIADRSKSKMYTNENPEANEKIILKEDSDEPQLELTLESSTTERPSSAPVRSSSSVTNLHERSTGRDAHVRHTTNNNNSSNEIIHNSSNNNNNNCSNSISSTNNFVNINSNIVTSSNHTNNVTMINDRESSSVENINSNDDNSHSPFVLPLDQAIFPSKKSSLRSHSASKRGDKSRSSSNTRRREEHKELLEEELKENIQSNAEINAQKVSASFYAEQNDSNYEHQHQQTNENHRKKGKHKQNKLEELGSGDGGGGKEYKLSEQTDSTSLSVTNTHKKSFLESDLFHSLTSNSSQSNLFNTVNDNNHHHHNHNHHHHHHHHHQPYYKYSNNKDNDNDALYSNGKTYSVLSKKKLQSKFAHSQRHSLQQEERELEEEEQEFAHLKTQSYGVMLSESVEH